MVLAAENLPPKIVNVCKEEKDENVEKKVIVCDGVGLDGAVFAWGGTG